MGTRTMIMVCVGFIFVALGAIGLLLPVWPTTPFLILATGCFSSAPELREKMMKIPFFSDHIRNYQDRKGLSEKSVIISLLFLWSMIMVSCVIIQKMWLVVILLVIALLVTVHILWMAVPKR